MRLIGRIHHGPRTIFGRAITPAAAAICDYSREISANMNCLVGSEGFERLTRLGPAALNANADRAAALPAGVWTFSRGSESVRELTIFSDRLGISVSLLQFAEDAHVPDFDDEQVWDTYDQFETGQS